jgi:1-acyl-sn-glycerol-3-phosphate acyltransferase
MKKEWFKFPFKQLIEPIGGLPIDRGPRGDGSHKLSAVEAMADLFNQHDELILVITPEGTRSKVSKWKTGFYHIARKANVPIVLSYLDYENKKGVVGKIMYPSDDLDADMTEIMDFYRTHGHGKYPDQFSIDERYLSA